MMTFTFSSFPVRARAQIFRGGGRSLPCRQVLLTLEATHTLHTQTTNTPFVILGPCVVFAAARAQERCVFCSVLV